MSNANSVAEQSPSLLLAQSTFRKINALFNEFLSWLATNTVPLPDNLDVSSDGWYQLEARIEHAAAAGDYKATERECDEYVKRAEKFFASWRRQLSAKAQAEK